MKIIKRVVWDVAIFFRKKCWYIVAIFTMNYLAARNYYGYDSGGVNSTMLVYFMGIRKMDLDLLRFLFFTLPIAVEILCEINSELVNRFPYRAIKYGEIKMPLIILGVEAYIKIAIYYALGFCCTWLYIKMFPAENVEILSVYLPKIASDYFCVWQAMYLVIYTWIMVLFCAGVGILLKNINLALLIYDVIFLFFSLAANKLGDISYYLPFAQINLSVRQNCNSPSIYMLLQIVIIIGCTIGIFKRKLEDILFVGNDEA